MSWSCPYHSFQLPLQVPDILSVCHGMSVSFSMYVPFSTPAPQRLRLVERQQIAGRGGGARNPASQVGTKGGVILYRLLGIRHAEQCRRIYDWLDLRSFGKSPRAQGTVLTHRHLANPTDVCRVRSTLRWNPPRPERGFVQSCGRPGCAGLDAPCGCTRGSCLKNQTLAILLGESKADCFNEGCFNMFKQMCRKRRSRFAHSLGRVDSSDMRSRRCGQFR